MKKILLSLLTVGTVAVVALTATTAFFSDTETSEGNLFQSGGIDLLVDSQAHYAGMECVQGFWVEESQGSSTRPDMIGDECLGTWEATNLGATNQFFNYSDLKPGDNGENTISLRVVDNDAWMCAMITNMSDDDNGLTEPEEEAGDETDGVGNGELAQELHFFAWAEDDGDNVWEANEPKLFSNTEGPASDVLDGVVYPMYTPLTTAFPGGVTKYIGMYWCYGDITVNEGNNTLACSGEAVGNMSQTDSLSADISFYVEQARNNPDFTCPQPENVERVFVGVNLENYETPDDCNVTVGSNIQGAINAANSGDIVCVEDGTYNETLSITKPLTLASVNGPTNSATITGGINVKSSDVNVVGFIVNPGTILGENAAIYLDGGISNVSIMLNDLDGTSEAASRGVVTVTNGSYTNVLVSRNQIHDFSTGIYTNPGTNQIEASYNDFFGNAAGIGGFTGVYVNHNQFSGGGEAIGADGSYDGSLVEFNNFIDGSSINDYGVGVTILAENNFFGPSGGVVQAVGNVDYTPEAGAQYPHN